MDIAEIPTAVLTENDRFQYVTLQMREFQRPVTTNSTNKILENLPRGLDEIYDRIFCRLTQNQRRLAI